MKPMPLSLVASVVHGELNAPARECAALFVQGFAVDSRNIGNGDLFVAIEGERVDGHAFVTSAVEAGALAALVSREVEGAPCLIVPDPVAALGEFAAWYRQEILEATVIGITGSSGKTTTKDLIAEVLDGEVVAAHGSFNTEVGLPLSIVSATETTQYLVLEMGMRGLGHIRYLAELAKPDIGVVLNVGSAHVGMMDDPSDIARAKAELVQSLSVDGNAVLNADDPQVAAMADQTDAAITWFGTGSGVEVAATDIEVGNDGCPSFALRIADGETIPVSLTLHGEHFVESALAAAAVGHLCGMTAPRIAEKLNAARARSRWRMEVHTTRRGVTVICDAYNANPESMRAALKALRSMGQGRRTWAVLGEMRELGELSVDEHDAIGRLAVRLDISRLVCVGPGTKVMHLAASNEGSWGEESQWVEDAQAAMDLLDRELAPGDVVLVKASRAVGLEVIAEHLLDSDRLAS